MRIDKALKTFTMFRGRKDEDDVNVHIAQNLSASYSMAKNTLLSRT